MSTDTPDKPSAAPPVAPVTDAAQHRADETEVVARLKRLKPAAYDRVRREEARALGIQVKTLDDLVNAARAKSAAGSRAPYQEHEPAEQPVDPAKLLNDITLYITRYVILDPEQAEAVALWVVHTHVIDAVDTSPILIISAPERACAKTLLQTLIGRLAYRSLPAANASLSVLFRAIESWQPTLFIDEADTFFRDNAELHGLVNAGYNRAGYVLRTEAVGDGFEPRKFNVFSAKSIAGIALERHLPDPTMSRGIVINMRRKLPHEKVERMRNASDDEFSALASRIARFALDYAEQVRLARPHLPDALSDRAQDNWEPLLAIAQCAGSEWLDRATRASLVLSKASESVANTGNELLADIKDVFDGKNATRLKTVDLLEELIKDDEKPWSTYNRGRPITPRQIAKQLEVYGVKPKTVRLGPKDTPKGYERAQFEDAWARYLKVPDEASESEAADSPQQRERPPDDDDY